MIHRNQLYIFGNNLNFYKLAIHTIHLFALEIGIHSLSHVIYMNQESASKIYRYHLPIILIYNTHVAFWQLLQW